MLLRSLVGAAFVGLAVTSVRAQDPALLHRDSLWNSLRLRGDAQGLAPLLADDWRLTHSDGRVQDKRDDLAGLAAGRFRFTRTWVLRDGQWVMVASHSSRCGEGVTCAR